VGRETIPCQKTEAQGQVRLRDDIVFTVVKAGNYLIKIYSSKDDLMDIIYTLFNSPSNINFSALFFVLRYDVNVIEKGGGCSTCVTTHTHFCICISVSVSATTYTSTSPS
jgi:hypothetical protein